MRALQRGVELTFSAPLDPESIQPAAQKIQVQSWAYQRSAKYGSDRYDEKTHAVTGARLSADEKILSIDIADMAPCWQMLIRYQLKSAEGKNVTGDLQHTIHELPSIP